MVSLSDRHCRIIIALRLVFFLIKPLFFRHGWKKLYVIVSSKKIIFFNSEAERQNADPTLILDLK